MTEDGEHGKEMIEATGTEVAMGQPQEPTFLEVVERLSARPDIPVEKIKQLMEMQEHVLDRQAKQEYNAAMSRVQAKIRSVMKDANNDQTKSKYSRYETIVVSVAPIYTAEGFSISFYEGETERDGYIKVMADVMHEAGWRETRYIEMPMDDKGMAGKTNKTQVHAKGSSFKYGQRNLMCLVFNIPTGEDDDGNAGGGMAEVITEKQAIVINEALEDPSQNREGFLGHMKAASVEEILAKDYAKAMQTIKARTTREPGEEG